MESTKVGGYPPLFVSATTPAERELRVLVVDLVRVRFGRADKVSLESRRHFVAFRQRMHREHLHPLQRQVAAEKAGQA